MFQPARIFKATTCFYTQNTADARFVAKIFKRPCDARRSIQAIRSTFHLRRNDEDRQQRSHVLATRVPRTLQSTFIDEARLYAN